MSRSSAAHPSSGPVTMKQNNLPVNQSNPTNGNSPKLLFDSLDQLDLGQFRNATLPTSSYDQLYALARSIAGLNVAKDLSTVKNRDEYDQKLTKLLQLCQTIIDRLLVDNQQPQAPPQNNTKNGLNSFNNNLVQENAKLRKLLTLQQKAIAFRRANLWTTAFNSNNNSNTLNEEEDELSTSAAVDNLPEDSKSAELSCSAKSSSTAVIGLQCVYCPKVFSDTSSFAKHLSLRHLSSSVDDGLPSSIASSSDSFLQRLQQQKRSILEISTSNPIAQPFHNQTIIDQLKDEIGQLRTKLTETEQTLREERHRRTTFESDIKSGLELNVQQIQSKLLEKIEEVKHFRNEARLAADQANDANRTCNQLVNHLSFPTSPNVAIVKGSGELFVEKHEVVLNSKSSNKKEEELHQQEIKNEYRKDKPKTPKVTKTSRVEKEMQELIAQRLEKLKNNQDSQKQPKQTVLFKTEEVDDSDNDISNQDETSTEVSTQIEKINDENNESCSPSISTEKTSESKSKEESTLFNNQLENKLNSIDPQSLRQTLRLQLITELTTKRSERQNGQTKQNKDIQKTEESDENTIVEIVDETQKKEKGTRSKSKKTLSDNANKTTQQVQPNKELTKAEIHSSLENRIRDYIGKSADVFVTDSLSAVSTSTEKEPNRVESPQLDESKFKEAMTKVQRDRDLLISQSRHDYDFVQIESSLRDLIETKVRSKLSTRQPFDSGETTNSRSEENRTKQNAVQDYLVEEPPDLPSTQPNETEQTEDSVVEIVEEENDNNMEESSTPMFAQSTTTKKDTAISNQPPKSILKTRKGQNRRKSLEEFDEFDKSVNLKSSSAPASRRISFSDQVIEYPISPRESSSEDDEEDDDERETTVQPIQTANSGQRRNQMFVIRSIDSNFNDLAQRYQQTSANKGTAADLSPNEQDTEDTFGGEKVYINQYSSTSSSSSDEEIEEVRDQTVTNNVETRRRSLEESRLTGDHNNNNSFFANAPQPAQRKTKTNNTLNSLLSDDLSATTDNTGQITDLSSKATRVHELAELIERKLQQKSKRKSEETESNQVQSLAGAVDTLPTLRSVPTNDRTKELGYDIYDF